MVKEVGEVVWWLKKHKFLIRTFLTLILVFLMGFIVAGVIISYITVEDYVAAQQNYEHERMQKDADKLNEKLININTAVLQIYQPYEGESMVAILFEERTEESEREIEEFVMKTVQSNPYITDVVFLDVPEKKVYFQSKIISQRQDYSYDWFSDSFVQKVAGSSGGVLLQENHILQGVDREREVCTLGHRIANSSMANFKDTGGIILIQIPTTELFEPMEVYQGKQEGKTFVLDRENHVVYTNQSEISAELAVKIYNNYQKRGNSDSDQYLVQSKKLVTWSGITYVNILDKKALFLQNYRRVLLSMFPILLGCIIICFLAMHLTIYRIGKRIDRIVDYTKIIQSGNFKDKLPIYRDDEFTVIEQGMNVMAEKLEHYIEEKYSADIALKKAQIQSLQLQMNPHFMFNTLENIRSAAISDGDRKGADMISVLGDMYRWNLQKPDIVSLEDELDYLEYYFELQENRYQGRLFYVQEIPEKFWACRIPKLTLQPIVENCLNHGFTPNMEYCQIRLQVKRDQEKSFCIAISDNGLGMSEEDVAQLEEMLENQMERMDVYHIGMRNIHQRIQLLFGTEFGLRIESREGEGTTVFISLPYMGRNLIEGEKDYVSNYDS